MGSTNTHTVQDREAIEALCAEYCYRFDEHDIDGWVSLFTEDVVAEYTDLDDPLYGHEDVRAAAEGWIRGSEKTRIHTLANPLITVDGETGTGKWSYRMVILSPDGSASVGQGIYEHDYRKVADCWKISALTSTIIYTTEQPAGWATLRQR